MTFRARITASSSVAVAVAIVAVSSIAYIAVRGELRRQVDQTLEARVGLLRNIEIRATPDGLRVLPPPALGGAGGYTQLVTRAGRAVGANGIAAIPVSERARRVAAGRAGAYMTDATVHGTHVRVITVPMADGIALQVARPLDEIDRVLARMRWFMLLAAIAGIGIAAGIGYLVSRAALAPVEGLTRAAEDIARTRDPGTRIDATGEDELARLGQSFNTMLGALDESLRAQRRLVADASHELRTPLTSLRTNIEVLARADSLSDEDRARIRADILSQIDELTLLVGDLVELARPDEQTRQVEDVRFDEVVARALEAARTHHPGVTFTASLEPSVVRAVPQQLARAVANLIDNAAKFGGGAGEVEVALRGGELAVRDHGPGIAAEDLPHVFDRFFRSAGARALPGSGLGLAIARDVAESHGGRVGIENADGQGARATLWLPGASPPEEQPEG